MGLFDYFAKPQPAPTAPDVMDKPPMTDYHGKIINADSILWRVHQYIIDTSISKIIYDKYYQCDSEYQARSLANNLNSQSLAGACVNRCDWWGEYSGQTFQAALAQIRDKIASDYAGQFERLAQKQSDSKVKAMDSLNKKYYDLKQDYINLKADYDKREEDYKSREAQLKAALQRQIDDLRQQEQEPSAPSAPPIDVEAIQAEAIDKARLIVKERTRIIINDVIHVLTQPEKNEYRASRLIHDADFVRLKGDTATKLVKYYLYKLIED